MSFSFHKICSRGKEEKSSVSQIITPISFVPWNLRGEIHRKSASDWRHPVYTSEIEFTQVLITRDSRLRGDTSPPVGRRVE